MIKEIQRNMLAFCAVMLLATSSHGAKDTSKKNASVPTGHRIYIFQEDEMTHLYKAAAAEVIKVLAENPTAVVLLPTGSTPEKMYNEIIAHFKEDPSFDLSEAQFFNLDEYVGLSSAHPLSYSYYMNLHFYKPLRDIDAARAPQPENSHILSPKNDETPQETLNRFKADLAKAGTIDLAILGVGGAFVTTSASGKTALQGGHIAFNEPGTKPTQETHMVTLTTKTRKDTKHRFSSLQSLMDHGDIPKQAMVDVPLKALTIGLKEILSAKKIMMLATGENKEPVIREVFKRASNPDFPASYLLKHANVSWYFDEFAAKSLNTKPWLYVESSTYFPKHWLQKGARNIAMTKDVAAIEMKDFMDEGLPGEVVDAYRSHRFRNVSAPQAIAQDLAQGLTSNVNELPQNQKILILSPHPDDDVISMGATLKKLMGRGNEVHVVYAVTGYNAVRTSIPAYHKEYKKLDRTDPVAASLEAKTRVREREAEAATAVLGVSPRNLHHFRADYYRRRGIPAVEAFSKADHVRMQALLVDVDPDVIFFAAEDDPHGAHGLASKLVAQSLASLGKHGKLTGVSVMGYRGAWNEWNLDEPEFLTFVTFDEEEMAQKVVAIKEHKSQLDPLFPGHDTREFYERAQARNRDVATEYFTLVGSGAGADAIQQAPYMEVFKRFTTEEFIKSYR